MMVSAFIETGEDEDVYSSDLLCKGSLFRTQSGSGIFLSRRDHYCAKKLPLTFIDFISVPYEPKDGKGILVVKTERV